MTFFKWWVLEPLTYDPVCRHLYVERLFTLFGVPLGTFLFMAYGPFKDKSEAQAYVAQLNSNRPIDTQ